MPGDMRERHLGRWILVGLAVLAAVAVILAILLGGRGSGDNPGPAITPPSTVASVPTTTTTTPDTVRVNEADYLGEQATAAAATLGGLGLRVRTVPVETDASPAGTVVGVSPTGNVPKGQTVTLQVATPPATPTTTPTTPTTTTTSPTTTPGPDASTDTPSVTGTGGDGASHSGPTTPGAHP
jgi:serine/threonine-protein kinase